MAVVVSMSYHQKRSKAAVAVAVVAWELRHIEIEWIASNQSVESRQMKPYQMQHLQDVVVVRIDCWNRKSRDRARNHQAWSVLEVRQGP